MERNTKFVCMYKVYNYINKIFRTTGICILKIKPVITS